MSKTTKVTLAAALFVGSIGFAMAQGTGSSGGSAEGRNTPGQSDARPAPAEQGKGSAQTGGTADTSAPAMQQKNTGMGTPPSAGPNETGTAKDSAGGGANRQQK